MSLHRNDSKQKMKENAHQATLVEDQATRMHNRSLEQVKMQHLSTIGRFSRRGYIFAKHIDRMREAPEPARSLGSHSRHLESLGLRSKSNEPLKHYKVRQTQTSSIAEVNSRRFHLKRAKQLILSLIHI